MFLYLGCVIIRGVLHLDISFGCWFFKILQPALRENSLDSYFHFIIQILRFFEYYGPNHRFPFRMRRVHRVPNTLSSSANLGSFSVRHLKRSCTLLLDAINDCTWCVCFFISEIVYHPMLYEAISSLQLSPLSVHLIIENFYDFIKVTFLPACSTLFFHLWIFEVITLVW
jgi:hypothetical protein